MKPPKAPGDKLATSFLVHLAQTADYKYLVALVIESCRPSPTIHQASGRQPRWSCTATAHHLWGTACTCCFACLPQTWTDRFLNVLIIGTHCFSSAIMTGAGIKQHHNSIYGIHCFLLLLRLLLHQGTDCFMIERSGHGQIKSLKKLTLGARIPWRKKKHRSGR